MMTSAPSRLAARIAIALGVVWALLGASFLIGVDRGMDHELGMGPLNEINHLAVAISDDVYHLDQGYVGFSKVKDSLRQSFDISDWNGWASSPETYAALKAKLDDCDFINKALVTAASIPGLKGLGQAYPASLQTFQQLDLMTVHGEDPGESALFEVAFRLFGLNIQGAYYLFYIILATSIMVFVFEFYGDAPALCVLIFAVLAHHLFFYTNYFQPFVPTVYINRFVSTLSVIPAIHFSFLLLERRRPYWCSLVFAAVQLAVLLFSILVRSSGNWAVLGLVGLLGILLVLGAWQARHRPGPGRLRSVARSMRFWPVGVMLGGIVALGIYVNAATHPIYHTLDDQAHHMRWHNAWLGLQLNPDWKKYYPNENNHMADMDAFNLTWDHLKSEGRGEDFISKYTHDLKIGLHDQYIRGQFLDFLEKHPFFVAKTDFYYKPILFVQQMSDVVSSLDPKAAVPVAGVLLLTVSLCLIGVPIASYEIWRALGTVTVLFGASVAPVLWAYPQEFVMSDQIAMSSLFALTAAWAVLVAMGRFFFASRRQASMAQV